jgi:hypothetical protein
MANLQDLNKVSIVGSRKLDALTAMRKFTKYYSFQQNMATPQANVSFRTLPKILDECITRIRKGETIETCLSEYSDMQEHIKPLLDTSFYISANPKVTLSDNYKRTSKIRLMNRITRL